MSTANVINIEALLSPISDDNPAGTDIRGDASPTSIYYKIKDARGGARSSERRILMDDDPDQINIIVPEWATVLETAPEILKSHAKDLEVAAWYTEGLLRHHGLAGLRDGFTLIHGLVDGFWDDLYPMPDEDGMETRVAPLIGLNGDGGDGTLMIPINKIALTQENTYPSFATWNYEQAIDIEKITDPKKKAARVEAGGISLEMIQLAARESSAEFINTFKEDLDGCIEAFSKMTAILDEKAKNDSPPSSNIRKRLERLKEVMGFLRAAEPAAAATEESSPAPAESSPATPTAAAPTAPAVAVPAGAITSREEAHKTILKVAEFFRQTEPHSPVPFALEQAVRWGKMSLPELLSELISDDKSRQSLFTLTGIPYEGKKK